MRQGVYQITFKIKREGCWAILLHPVLGAFQLIAGSLFSMEVLRGIAQRTSSLISMGFQAAIAQLGERQTEDLEVPSSILGHGI